MVGKKKKKKSVPPRNVSLQNICDLSQKYCFPPRSYAFARNGIHFFFFIISPPSALRLSPAWCSWQLLLLQHGLRNSNTHWHLTTAEFWGNGLEVRNDKGLVNSLLHPDHLAATSTLSYTYRSQNVLWI